MPHALLLAHMQNTRYIHGGAVYRESIRAMLMANEAGLRIDEVFVHPQHHPLWRQLRQVADVLASPFSHFPAKVNHFRTRDFRRRLRALCAATPYRLFIINGAEMLWCLDHLPAAAQVLYISHNIEHQLYQEQVAKYREVPLLGRLLRADATKFRAFEISHLRRLERIVSIAEADREILAGLCQPTTRIITILPSFAYPPHARQPRPGSRSLRLGFLGNLEWWPNRRSLDWFLHEIWPRLGPTVELHLYGQGSQALDDGGRLHGHGFVADLAQVWEEVDLMIQPIVCGAGINIKVAESLYNRMPMLVTPLALRGIHAHDDPAVKILGSAQDWVAYLNSPAPALQAQLRVREENALLFCQNRNRARLADLLPPPRP